MLDGMSQANRAQTEQWLGTIWDNMLAEISVSRSITVDSLQAIADGYRIRNADDAVAYGLATDTKYYDEVVEILKVKSERDEDEDLKLVAFSKYLKSPALKKEKDTTPEYKKKKIAVIYATGGINSGKSGDDEIGSETFAKAIKEAREDSTIKAIVLRVNSGGGSALASDVIWRETVLAKATKPFVVSMGDVAASGGYYISADADKIFAMPNTITGSIGVFGMIPNVKGLVTGKMGVTFDGVKTADHADFVEITRPLTDTEFNILQTGVDRTYNVFLERVSEGRDMSVASIDEIGQGRVWSGTDATQIGLVDEMGGLNDAIAAAAELAGLEEYRVSNYPERLDPFEEFMENFNAEINAKLLAFQFGDNAEIIKEVEKILEIKNMRGIQARLPYVYDVK
jgi:protease-4